MNGEVEFHPTALEEDKEKADHWFGKSVWSLEEAIVLDMGWIPWDDGRRKNEEDPAIPTYWDWITNQDKGNEYLYHFSNIAILNAEMDTRYVEAET
jgi:hypothetical protein